MRKMFTLLEKIISNWRDWMSANIVAPSTVPSPRARLRTQEHGCESKSTAPSASARPRAEDHGSRPKCTAPTVM